MKLRPLTLREKNYAVIVSVLMCLVMNWGVESRLSRRSTIMSDELGVVENRLDQTKKLLEAAIAEAAARRPKAADGTPATKVYIDKKESLHLLRDLTIPELTDRVKILNAEKRGREGFSITVSGEFAEVMGYLSFLERQEARFLVSSAVFSRGGETPKGNEPPSRTITAVILLASKG